MAIIAFEILPRDGLSFAASMNGTMATNGTAAAGIVSQGGRIAYNAISLISMLLIGILFGEISNSPLKDLSQLTIQRHPHQTPAH